LPRPGEADVGACNQIFHGSGYKAFARLGQGCDTGRNMHGDAAHVVCREFHLAGVKARADFDAKWLHCCD
jgi:hypothetical protein